MKMGHLSVLFISLIASFSSLGSLIQTSYSHGNSDPGRATRSTDRNNGSTPDILSSEYLFYSPVEGSGQSIDQKASQEVVSLQESKRAGNKNHSGSTIKLITTPALTLHQGADKANSSITGYTHTRVHVISQEDGSHVTTADHLKESHTFTVNEDFPDGLDSPKLLVQNNTLTQTTNQSMTDPAVSCGLDPSHCVVLTDFNGTNLLWDDMRRTLAFAWELHVFGSAGLFILMAALAVIGMASARALPHPLCDALTLANTLLILNGSLRGVLLLLDPYGTRQVLSRATLAALHNVPLQLLLWAQAALALVTLRGFKSLLFPLKLHQPWVVGGLAISHCIPLLVADLFSPTLSPALPLLLQTLSLCWGLPFCMRVLIKSLSHLHPVLWSTVPQWIPSHGVEKRAKRLTAVCAFFGFLCFSLQMYSLLWLYGLLGNWRRFGWGWWLSQFWARILELAWGFSLLILASWVFWTPSRGLSRGDHGQGRSEMPKVADETSLWGRVLANIQKRTLTTSEKTWEDLMPSNWSNYKLSHTGFNNSLMCPYDDQPSSIASEYKSDPVSISGSEPQTALLWQKVGEHECILSLIEFDMRPPSPINLRRSIDNALQHGQLAGGLFTPPLPSWMQSLGADTGGNCDATYPPAYFDCGWTSVSSPKESTQSVTADYNGGVEYPAAAHQGEERTSTLSAVIHQLDWSEDEVTDL